MGAFVKQALALIAGNMSGSNNKAKFIVRTMRTGYIASGGIIAVVWYTAYRNERVSPGEISFPVPGLKKLTRKNPPDRPEKELPKQPSESWGNSSNTSGVNLKEIVKGSPHLSFGLPQTPAAARALQGVGNFEGKVVANWIIPYLVYARSRGWAGQVTQGFRTYSEELSIWNSGIRPAAKPGTSNHGKKNFPGGAVDVTGAEQLARILAEIPGGSLLKWAGSKDPVHFSYPHNGGY